MLIWGCSTTPKGPSVSTDKAAAEPVSSIYKTLEPQKTGGTDTIGNDTVIIDITYASLGYYYITYLGQNPKVKLQVTGPDGIKYTYNLDDRDTVLPISGGSGSYELVLYENLSGKQYATAYSGSFDVSLKDELLPFLYPNKHVNFTQDSKAVTLAKELTASCPTDLDSVGSIYHYITGNISYDYDKAESVEYNYVPEIDKVLAEKKGICYDYASLMTAMLRSLSIPTKLQIGYAGDTMHAWISTYIKDIGWVDGIISFDGNAWTLMDPTFAANSEASALKKYIGDGSNYKLLYSY